MSRRHSSSEEAKAGDWGKKKGKGKGKEKGKGKCGNGTGTGTGDKGSKDPGKNILGDAVTVRLKARQVNQTADQGKFPEYGEWEVLGKALLTGAGGNVSFT